MLVLVHDFKLSWCTNDEGLNIIKFSSKSLLKATLRNILGVFIGGSPLFTSDFGVWNGTTAARLHGDVAVTKHEKGFLYQCYILITYCKKQYCK